MTKPMPKITGLVEKASPEILAAAKQMPKLSGEFEEIEVVQEKDALQAEVRNIAVMLPLAKIRKSPYQNRNLDETHVANLATIIESDGLNQPITVRRLPDGFYEMISGEHRFEACKMLGYEAIPAFIRDADDLSAARSLIFDNIHHKDLTDYEIFKGFKTLKKLDPKTSVRSLARDTGWSIGRVQKILSFEKLPAKVHEMLEQNPTILGGNAAQALAQHVENALSDYVIEAVRLIRDGRLTQARASAWIESRVKPKQQVLERVLTKPNGKKFCEIIRRGSTLSLKLARGIDIEDIERKIYEFLKMQTEKDDETC